MSSPSFVSKVALVLACLACCAVSAYAGFELGRAVQFQIDRAEVQRMLKGL